VPGRAVVGSPPSHRGHHAPRLGPRRGLSAEWLSVNAKGALASGTLHPSSMKKFVLASNNKVSSQVLGSFAQFREWLNR